MSQELREAAQAFLDHQDGPHRRALEAALAAPRAPEGPPDARGIPSAKFLETYESIGHWCPNGDKVRPYSFAVCSMCMGHDAIQIVQLRGGVSRALPEP